jgi:acyl dehydratase
MPKLYAKALLASLPGRGGEELPELELSLPEVTIDARHLAAYDHVCGFRLGDRLPPTYLHVFAFPVAMKLMTDRSFPLPLLGLVHVRNRIVQARPVDSGETVSLSVHAENLRRTDRGTEVDLVAEADVDDERVWSSTSTYLRRGGDGGSGETSSAAAERHRAAATWQLDGDVGRRYARVSGDINPIHLSPLTSRLFGFPRPIAHGMWTKARCIAALEGLLPERLVAEVEFKKPLLLPAKVAFADTADGDGRSIGLRDARSGAPHLTGTVQPG